MDSLDVTPLQEISDETLNDVLNDLLSIVVRFEKNASRLNAILRNIDDNNTLCPPLVTAMCPEPLLYKLMYIRDILSACSDKQYTQIDGIEKSLLLQMTRFKPRVIAPSPIKVISI